jgi:hypothetical protein
MLQQAVSYLNLALRERPLDQELNDERTKASKFLEGAIASEGGDWVEAIDDWKEVQDMDPNYQGGVLRGLLRDAYPKAARQLIAEANGSATTLGRAIDYLEESIAWNRGDETLVAELEQERDRIEKYLAGSEAFGIQNWDGAIFYWGAIYTVDPGYQNGALERNLRQACANSPQPDEEVCLP